MRSFRVLTWTEYITKSDGGDFIFDQVYAAFSSIDAHNAAFRGYNNGALIGEQIATLNHRDPTLVDVSWAAIDQLA